VRIRKYLEPFIWILPASRLKNRVLRALGNDIDPTARVAPSVVWNVDCVRIGPNAGLGPGNVIRDLSSIELGDHAVIGQWNWISASLPLRASGGAGSFSLGRHSALTSRHYVDASGGVRIGDFSTVAGARSTFISHGIDWRASRQTTRPIRIGDYCLIGSNTNVTPGTVVEDRVVTGMGGTLAGRIVASSLAVQARVEPVKRQLEGDYFARRRGFVSPD
jgi:acetyltransferase-like isoleucine patch superfamily enzyme